eukprot:m.100565 g.100565  ORF g.100565 m.100565 type:complete len:292 (+) comp15631_c0_seq1:114-989(+)
MRSLRSRQPQSVFCASSLVAVAVTLLLIAASSIGSSSSSDRGRGMEDNSNAEARALAPETEMFEYEFESTALHATTLQFKVNKRNKISGERHAVTWTEATHLLANTPDTSGSTSSAATSTHFAQRLTAALLSSGFKALFWECAPVSRASMAAQPFEFVVLSSPRLELITAPDTETFASHLRGTNTSDCIRSFANLGRDAVLVVPAPLPEGAAEYMHLAAFLRNAPPQMVDALWRGVGRALSSRLHSADLDADTPVWLSTSGLGVAWLHVRIDRVPKYYNYQPYRFGKPVPK